MWRFHGMQPRLSDILLKMAGLTPAGQKGALPLAWEL